MMGAAARRCVVLVTLRLAKLLLVTLSVATSAGDRWVASLGRICDVQVVAHNLPFGALHS